MRDRLLELQARTAALEPDGAARAALHAQVEAQASAFLEGLPQAPAYQGDEDHGRGLYESPIGDDPVDMAEALALFDQYVLRPGCNPASPRFMGYIPGGGIYYASLGDYLAAVTNRYAGIFFASPGAVRIERLLVHWLIQVGGYPPGSTGDLTSGGSIANLTGIVTARDAMHVRPRDVERSVIYSTSQAHHSLDKAIRIAGLSDCVHRTVPLDERYRMRAGALEQAIAADKAAGLNPWLVIASAGTTDTGAVDPLEDVAAIARAREMWLHVDGAYGAFFVLAETGRPLLQAIALSDSLVMDPHKGLFLPYGTGAVLVKNGPALQESYYYSANYMQDTLAARDETSPAEVSPELTRHFRGLRLWMALKLAGLAPFRAALEEKLLLARYFHAQLRRLPGFETGPQPDLSVVTFRYVPARGDANEFNQRLVQALQDDGRVFLSSTMLDGNFIIRLAVLSFRTHLADIELTIDVLQEKVRELERAA